MGASMEDNMPTRMYRITRQGSFQANMIASNLDNMDTRKAVSMAVGANSIMDRMLLRGAVHKWAQDGSIMVYPVDARGKDRPAFHLAPYLF